MSVAPTLEPREQLGVAFRALTASLRRLRGRETHRPGELSYSQYGLLFGLAHGGALPARDLALSADLSPATVAQMLEGLERAGLVRRVRSERDKRVVLTSLTARGREVLERRREQLEPRWRAALAGISDQELLIAADVLERLRAMFDELALAPGPDQLDEQG